MSERDFSIGERNFKLNKVDAFKQFHIVRRLGPVIGEIIPVAQKLHRLQKDNLSEAEMYDQISQLAGPIFAGMAKLSDDDANRVLLGLCSAVEMQQMPKGNWARVATDAGLMFQDLDLVMLMQIAGRAFAYNLGNFSAALPQTSRGGA